MDQAISPRTLQRRGRKTLLVAFGALALVAAAAWGVNRVISPSVPAGDILMAEVRRGDVANAINAAGVVVPLHEELVTSQVQTRVAKLHTKPGQQVAAGDLLLELDDRGILLAIESIKEQLAQQENRIVGLTQEMEQKRKQLASSIELLSLDLQSAQAKWERNQKLRKFGAVSAEDMLTAELNVKRNEIQLRQQREQIADNGRSTATNIDGARLQKAILSKQLDQQQQLLAQTRVRAPFAGMLTWALEEEGASVAVGQTLAKVSDLNNYQVEATLSDFHAHSLAAGQPVRVEQGSVVLAGRVHTVLPEIQNGTVKLLVALDQPRNPALRNKLRVEVNIITEQKIGALVADNGPAFNGRGRQNVFVVRDGLARKTQLEIGAGDGKAVEIVSGARLGERLIVSDVSRFKELDSFRIAQ